MCRISQEIMTFIHVDAATYTFELAYCEALRRAYNFCCFCQLYNKTLTMAPTVLSICDLEGWLLVHVILTDQNLKGLCFRGYQQALKCVLIPSKACKFIYLPFLLDSQCLMSYLLVCSPPPLPMSPFVRSWLFSILTNNFKRSSSLGEDPDR